jgi:hypothetical protein
MSDVDAGREPSPAALELGWTLAAALAHLAEVRYLLGLPARREPRHRPSREEL